MEFSVLSGGGGSMKGNFLGSGSPIEIICRIRLSRDTRWISGVENACREEDDGTSYHMN